MNRKNALKQIVILAMPIGFGHLGVMLAGTGDMIVAGEYSRTCLAAIGLAISIGNPIMISLLGMQMAISPLLAQKRGAGESIDHYFWTIILYSLIVGTVSMALTWLSLSIIPWFNYGDTMNGLIHEYLVITSFSTFGLCLYQGLKEYLQAQEKAFAANALAIVSASLNFGFNYAFVFGKWGMPKLYEAGLAWATLGGRCFLGIGLFMICCKSWRTHFKIEWKFMKEVTKLGIPITGSLFFEIMAFCSVTLFVGKFAEIQTAANNLVLNIGSLAFMIPLSISAAASVKVGHAYGEKNLENIKIFSQMSLFASFCCTVLMGLCFYFFPTFLISLYTSDEEVLQWGVRLLFWVACFQIFDGAQVTISGILRGLGVTRASSLAIFIGYWMIGIPLGYYLGFYTNLESQGFWIGLALSLALVAMMLSSVLILKLKSIKGKGF